MSNFTPTGNPTTLSRGASSLIRAEYTLVQTAVNSKADIAGQVYTGTHDFTAGTTSVATAALADNSTTAASTEFVQTNIPTAVSAVYAPLASPALTGTPTAPTAAPGTNTTQIATTAFAYTNFAPSASPAFTGTPTAPTATTGTSTTQLATTAFVGATAFNAALPSQTGNSGKFVTTDGSNASWATVAQPCEQTLTATGTLTDGMVVALRSDGTVEPVVTTTATDSIGTAVQFNAAGTTYTCATYDSVNQKVIVAYRDAGNSNRGTAVAGTVSGTTITWGTPVVFDSNACAHISITFDASQTAAIICYQSNGTVGKAVAGTISGTVITFGTPVAFNGTHNVTSIACCYDPSTFKTLAAGHDTVNGSGWSWVVTATGNAVSVGSQVNFSSGVVTYLSMALDTVNNQIVSVYTDSIATFPLISAATISGTTSTWGAPVTMMSSTCTFNSLCYDSNRQLFVCAINCNGAAGLGLVYFQASAGRVIGTATTIANFDTSGSNTTVACAYDVLAKKPVVIYQGGAGLNEGRIIRLTPNTSGTIYTVSSYTQFDAGVSTSMAAVYHPVLYKVVGAYTVSSTAKGFVETTGYTSTNANNFLGISKSAVTNAAAQIATLGAKVTNQSGLTPNALYYLTDTGTLSTTPNNRKIGKATAATDLIIDTDDVSSGAWVLLSTVTAAGSATVDIEQTFSDAFDTYVILGENITCSAPNTLYARMKLAGSYSSTSYKWNTTQNTSTSNTPASSSSTGSGVTSMLNFGPLGVSTGDNGNFTAFLSFPATSKHQAMRWTYGNIDGTTMAQGSGAGHNTNAGVLTGVRFLMSSGVILSGTFRLYGIKK